MRGNRRFPGFSPRGFSPLWLGEPNWSVSCSCSPGYCNRESSQQRTVVRQDEHRSRRKQAAAGWGLPPALTPRCTNACTAFPKTPGSCCNAPSAEGAPAVAEPPTPRREADSVPVAAQGAPGAALTYGLHLPYKGGASLHREKGWKEALKLQQQERLKEEKIKSPLFKINLFKPKLLT